MPEPETIALRYFGRLQALEQVDALVDEFSEIAAVSGWSQEKVNETRDFFVEGVGRRRWALKGIRFTVEKALSPLCLTFDEEGYLTHWEKREKRTPPPGGGLRRFLQESESPEIHLVHTQTRLVRYDAKTHKTLIRILDYVKKKYVPQLEVLDPSGYWLRRDENLLIDPSRIALSR